MLALGLLVMVLLTLIGLTLSAIRSSEKAALLGPATQVSESLMNRTLYQVANDSPPGTKASFWAASGPSPWLAASETIGGVNYDYVIYANTVSGAGTNRLKKVDVVVSWWNTSSAAGTRQGYGLMQVHASRLLNEGAP
jgi:hypothetical protein